MNQNRYSVSIKENKKQIVAGFSWAFDGRHSISFSSTLDAEVLQSNDDLVEGCDFCVVISDDLCPLVAAVCRSFGELSGHSILRLHSSHSTLKSFVKQKVYPSPQTEKNFKRQHLLITLYAL